MKEIKPLSELKPCQCGGKAKTVYPNGLMNGVVVACGCGITTKIYSCASKAIAAWNNRPIEKALVEALRNLVEANKKLPANDGRIVGLLPLIKQSESALALAEGRET